MKNYMITSLRFFLFITLLCGGIYTLLITGIGQLAFPSLANGSQVIVNHEVKGSRLIGQTFSSKEYFKGREASVSQLAPFSNDQKKKVETRTAELLKENPTKKTVPIDLVTASASGVDPDISRAGAEFQVDRIAEARGISKEKIRAIINQNVKTDFLSNREFVNIIELNAALSATEN